MVQRCARASIRIDGAVSTAVEHADPASALNPQPQIDLQRHSQERRPALEMLYVRGSDLESPMGHDRVPVDGRDAAERLRVDHRGERVLSWDEIDAERVEAAFR